MGILKYLSFKYIRRPMKVSYLALSLILLSPSLLSASSTEDVRYMKDVEAPYAYNQETQIFTLKCDLSGFDGAPGSYDENNYCLEYKKYQADMILKQYTDAVNENYQNRPDLLKLFNEELDSWFKYDRKVALSTQQFYADASDSGRVAALRYNSLELKKILIHSIWFLWLAPQAMPEPIIKEAPH